MILLRVASGFTVHMINGVSDDQSNDLVLLNMAGPKQAVRATWAELMKNNGYRWIPELGGRQEISKNALVTIKTELPSGWVNWAMLNKQASTGHANIEGGSMYVIKTDLDDPSNFVPPAHFLPLFVKCVPFPVLPEWATFIWNEGFSDDRIVRLRNCSNISAFRVVNNLNYWKEDVIGPGIRQGAITF